MGEADFTDAFLEESHLTQAILTGANESDANLKEANLTEALVTNEQLGQSKTIEGAVFPDGTKVPEGVDYEKWMSSFRTRQAG